MATAVDEPERRIDESALDEPFDATGYESVRDELSLAIRRLRGDVPPGELARQLLGYDVPGHTHLVGLDRWGEKAVLYHCGDRYVVFVRYDDAGLAAGGARMDFLGPTGVDDWVERLRAYWGWRHPRYR